MLLVCVATVLVISVSLIGCAGGQSGEQDLGISGTEGRSVTANCDDAITPHFFTMSATNYTLTLAVRGSGTTSPPVGQHSYAAGTVVPLVAAPAGGCCFVSWTGAPVIVTGNTTWSPIGDVNAASTDITMDDNYTITANFALEEAVYFADPNLEGAVREAIGKPAGTIYSCEVKRLTSLEASLHFITDLAGLEYCTNLRYLSIGNNLIGGNISPVASLTNLTELYLYANQISDISALASLTKLERLGLAYNGLIRDVSPLANLANLTWLRLEENQISDISPLANLTNLTYLDLTKNQITDISALANLTELTELGLSINPISDISALAGLTNLTELRLVSNQIGDMSPLANLTNLTWLAFAENPINGDISALANLTNLTRLQLNDNHISDISPLANLTNLTHFLVLYRNQISDISPLANLTNLEWMHLWSNQISDISPLLQNGGLGAGDHIDIRSNPLSCDSIYIYIPQLQARQVSIQYDRCVRTATDTGCAQFIASNGTIATLTAAAAPASAPVTLPHGMFSFNITGLSVGDNVTVTVTLPDPVPVGTKWWKYLNASWYPLDIGSDDGDSTITVTLTDGVFPGDEDSIPGQVTDDGGPGNPGAVGWETYPVNKMGVLLPWIALLSGVIAGGGVLVLRGRRRGREDA